MDIKKSAKVNLEKQKSIFLQMGLILALGYVFIAFEYTQSDAKDIVQMATLEEAAMEEELIPITRQEEIKPPPPPPPPQLLDVLNIVNDDVVLDETIELVNEDVSQQTEVAIVEVAPEVEEEAEATVFSYAEVMPTFPGGDAEMMKFLSTNTKYPPLATERGIQGRVYVSFVVGRDGGITDVKVARSVDPSLDAEAVRVVKSMPKWKPGEQRGKPVRVSYSLPVNFVLN